MAKQLRAALYGRVSVKRNSKFAADDQLRVCEELCKRNGWRVVAKFKDEGISGGTSRRPAYQALRAAAQRGDFDIVIAEDSKRLWRAQGEQFAVLDEWINLGVDLVTVSGNDSRDPHFRVVISMQGAAAEYELKENRYRIRRGLESRALDGRATGGRVFGYNPAKGSSVTINREQAVVVRRIFKEYIAGHSPRTIAKNLNADGIASPGAGWEGRDGKWRQSGVRVIVQNPRYVGRVVWGAYKVQRKAGDSSSRKYLPGDKPIERQRPDLAIIDAATWRAAERRVKAMKEAHKTMGSRPLRHALSGLLKCSECGGSFAIAGGHYYACNANRTGGDHACSVKQRINRHTIESAVFAAVGNELLTPKFLAEFSAWFRKQV